MKVWLVVCAESVSLFGSTTQFVMSRAGDVLWPIVCLSAVATVAGGLSVGHQCFDALHAGGRDRDVGRVAERSD